MQMFKSQTENPVKDYEWKKNTDVQEAIETLGIPTYRQFHDLLIHINQF